MNKASKMTDKELMESWNSGKVWMMTVKDTGKVWRRGLKRMEEIEDEMRERKLGPYEI
jgi:hypothetical protein